MKFKIIDNIISKKATLSDWWIEENYP